MRSEGYLRARTLYVSSDYDPRLFKDLCNEINAQNVTEQCAFNRNILHNFVAFQMPPENLIWLLTTYGNLIDLNGVDYCDYTALMIAAAAPCDEHGIRILLSAGASPHCINSRGQRAIDVLLTENTNRLNMRCISLLIEAGSPLPRQRYNEVTNMYNHRQKRRRRCRLTAAAVLSKIGKSCCVLSNDMRRMIAQYVWSSQGQSEWVE